MTPATPIGRPLIRVCEVGSTMDLVADLADRGATTGATVLAGFQTAGRGRAGRRWQAPPWSSILMSFLHVSHRPQSSLGLLAPAVGLAVAQAVEHWLPEGVRVKWPNDVLVDGHKLAGILVTTRAIPAGGARVICGIGLNVSNPPESLPDTATSLEHAAGRSIGLETVLNTLLESLSNTLSRFEHEDDPEIVAAITQRLAWRGESVTVVDGDRTHTGTLAGIDLDGALRLLDPSGAPMQIVAGDLTRGPRQTAPSPPGVGEE